MTQPFPKVDCERVHPGLPVSDVAGGGLLHEAAGVHARIHVARGRTPTMAGVNLGDVQVFLEQGTPNPAGISVYFVVGNADELCDAQRANGVEIIEEPGDRPYGLRDYLARDLYGYRPRIRPLHLQRGEPIEIERVDVPVRLEKAAGGATPRSRRLQTHESEQLSRGDPAAHQRAAWRRVWRARTPRRSSVHSGAQEEARHRLRLTRQLPVRREVAQPFPTCPAGS